jgi:LysR family transcriptional regulator, low CO2-responsive transcriptional regulator
MLHITLRQLQVFEAVARNLSYSKAARELHLSQPAVSMQVRSLEESVGLPLTEQMGKRIFLTEAGREVLHYSQSIAVQLEDLGTALSLIKGLDQGQLKIAVASTANAVATDLLARFRSDHPKVSMHLDVTNRQEVLRELAANEIDLAIMGQPPEGHDLEAVSFMENPLVVIAPPHHPLAGKKRIPIQTLSGEPFLVREEGSGTRSATERFFVAHGVTPKTGLTMNTNEAIKQSVQAGMGLAVVALQTVSLEREAGRLEVLDVDEFPIARHWYVVHRMGKRLSTVAEAFKTFLLERS